MRVADNLAHLNVIVRFSTQAGSTKGFGFAVRDITPQNVYFEIADPSF